MSRKPKILIVTKYHPNETLAVQVGEAIFQEPLNSDVKVVQYTGKPDKNGSTRNLRKFVEVFDPDFSIILHSDDNLGADALIFYRRKAKERIRTVRKLLLTFIYRHSRPFIIFFGISEVRSTTKRTLIDFELGSEMEQKEAIRLIENFVQYLVSHK